MKKHHWCFALLLSFFTVKGAEITEKEPLFPIARHAEKLSIPPAQKMILQHFAPPSASRIYLYSFAHLWSYMGTMILVDLILLGFNQDFAKIMQLT